MCLCNTSSSMLCVLHVVWAGAELWGVIFVSNIIKTFYVIQNFFLLNLYWNTQVYCYNCKCNSQGQMLFNETLMEFGIKIQII